MTCPSCGTVLDGIHCPRCARALTLRDFLRRPADLAVTTDVRALEPSAPTAGDLQRWWQLDAPSD